MDQESRRLGGRERQIVDAIYALGSATATEVVDHLKDPEGYDSIRVILGKLARKGFLSRTRHGRSFVYAPAISSEAARRPAKSHLLLTIYAGSTSQAVIAYLYMSRNDISDEELDEIASWLDEQGKSTEP
jgi:predicted transcriptional regulator